MAGLSGKSTSGVGADIVDYMKEVATFFNITIQVTSGFRSPDSQATAMFDNWEKLEHGKVYAKAALPESDRVKLDEHFKAAKDGKAVATDRESSKSAFLKLAKQRLGSKSPHSRGRALDVSRTAIDARVYKALAMHLQEVKEGKRTDIYHFQSESKVPAVDEETKKKWTLIKDGKPAAHKAVSSLPGCVMC